MSELIKVNAVLMVEAPRMKKTKKKQVPFTLDEIDLLIDSTPTISMRNFLGISFFTGMRSGELLALKWSDIDFKSETISITKTVAQGVINSPKTNSSSRDIEMIDKAKDFFKNQLLQTGIKKEYVFMNAKNTHYGCNFTFYKYFKKMLNDLGLEYRSLHNTRHTFASMMLNNGINSLWVSNTLGHESLDITLKVYSHYIPKKEKMSIKFLENRYRNGTDSQ